MIDLTRHDPQGDVIAARERSDRALERADSPATHLDTEPQEACSECGYHPREVATGHWMCPCDLWSAAA